MPRALLLCSTIVAAFPLQLAAAPAPATVSVPVTTSVAALAERAGVDVARERGRFVHELIRRVYSPPIARQLAPNVVVGASEIGRAHV